MVAGGLALAVPSDAVGAFLGAPSGARRLGVALAPVVLPFGAPRARAWLVTGIGEGTVAERTGLALGDVIVATDRGSIPASDGVPNALAEAGSLDVVRAGKTIRLTLAWESTGGTPRAA